jgi:hypothetical protein
MTLSLLAIALPGLALAGILGVAVLLVRKLIKRRRAGTLTPRRQPPSEGSATA